MQRNPPQNRERLYRVWKQLGYNNNVVQVCSSEATPNCPECLVTTGAYVPLHLLEPQEPGRDVFYCDRGHRFRLTDQ